MICIYIKVGGVGEACMVRWGGYQLLEGQTGFSATGVTTKPRNLRISSK